MNMLFHPTTFFRRVAPGAAIEADRLSSRRSICHSTAVVVFILLAGFVNEGRADSQPEQKSGEPLKQLSLAQLGDVEVTTASKEPEEVWKTPAAVYVLSGEDI